MNTRLSRRGLLTSTAALLACGWLPAQDGRPPVATPRATDGDERFEPNWDERFTFTVTPEMAKAAGSGDRAIQAACDYVSRLGGGTVRLTEGTYTLRNAVWLPSRIRLQGSGPETVITKIASQTIKLSEDSDWYDQEITLAEAGQFQVGDGVTFVTKNPHNGSQTVIKRTLTARSGLRFKLNDGLRENLWLSGEPTCSSLFPLLTSENTADVLIENLTLDGNKAHSANLNGNYGGNIFIQDCNRYTIRDVVSRNSNGDGVSFQICHDVIVERLHSHDNADLGIHPGSGSQRPLIRDCRLERNGLGLFWCWGVKYGLAENCQILNSRTYGVSIGHNDTDNVMRNNEIRGSGTFGVLFRDENRGKDFWANRNTLENNRIIDNGGDDGAAIEIQGKTRDLVLTGNEIRETRGPAKRVGIRIGAAVGKVSLSNNTIEGFAQPLLDQRPA
jgi:polygalacturonase